MNQNKLELIYDVIINNGTLLDEEILKVYGINKPKETIEELLREGKIVERRKDKYKLTSIEGLYNYGIKLRRENKIFQAEQCFRRCNNIDSTHRESYLQQFLIQIQNKKYLNAYNILEIIFSLEPEIYQKENNLYLHLLSIIADCPKKYREQVKNISPSDISIPCNKDNEKACNEANEAKSSIMKYRLHKALKHLNTMIAYDLTHSVNIEIIKELIQQAQEVETNYKHLLLRLTKSKNYQLIKTKLESKRERKQISSFYNSIYELVTAIIEIETTKIIPQPLIFDGNDMSELIEGKNYELALELNNKYLDETNKSKEHNIIHLLLVEINRIISEIEQEQSKERIKQVLTYNLENAEEVKPIKEPICQNETDLTEQDIKEVEEIAYYLKTLPMTFSYNTKKIGLLLEQMLLVKLIYARDYYNEGDYENGDKLLHQVELSLYQTKKVTMFLEKIKSIKENTNKEKVSNTKKRKKRKEKSTRR